MPHRTGEPTGEPGTYKAAFDFDMPGEWNLILRFSKPSRDQVVISDMIERQAGGEDHSGHDMKKAGHDHSRGSDEDN